MASTDSMDKKTVEEVAISLPAHPFTKEKIKSKDASDSDSCEATKIIGASNAKVVKDAIQKALQQAPNRSIKTKHLRRYPRDVFDLLNSSRKHDLEKLLDRATDSSCKIVKHGKVITLLKHRIAEVS
mmetsp:Transcript_3192/g.5684  ORF Transcript_3192/g.5684 Transcript_3192/m.5684 type:complete len:127 (+) Transcript_3192:205-585(+)